jgi:flagellar hook-associated protein 1 FlgK
MSLFSTLNTGISGMNVSEIAIATVSNNIANADNEYYSRQRVVTQASTALDTSSVTIGTGVSVTSIVRIHDEYVYTRLKEAAGDLSYDTYMQQSLEEVAGYFPDLDGVGISTDIENYFAAWNDLSSNSDDGSQKIALVQSAETLSANLQSTRESIRTLQDSINEELKTNVDEINSIGEQIVAINKSINAIESTDSSRANDLRDQRDALELTLSELLDVSVYKGTMVSENTIDANLTDQGTEYNINIEGYSFVDGTSFHPIVISNSGNESAYYSIYAESELGTTWDITDKITGGKVGAMLDLRGRNIDVSENSGYPTDGTLQGYIDDLDTFANTFIEQTNNIYARSAQTSMTSASQYELQDNTTLSSYSENINDGTFDVIIYDNVGNEVARKSITINSLTSMNDDSYTDSIIKQITTSADDNDDNNTLNDVDDFVTADYSYSDTTKSGEMTLKINSEYKLAGYTVAVEDNGTNFPGVIGLSQFLEGDSAANIGVVDTYLEDADKLNGFSAPIDGNNDVANDMIQLQYETFDFNRKNGSTITESIEGFYRFVTTEIATDGESIASNYETSYSLYNTINSEFQSISGVNIDEELTDLMKYQTAYSANAKVITTIEQMLTTLLGIKD